MGSYVAFLRGINAGVTVKMSALSELFTGLGYTDVRTVLATGNVIFKAPSNNPAAIEKVIEKALFEALGYASAAIVMTKEEIADVVQAQPFKDAAVTRTSVPQVTLLQSAETGSKLNYPYAGKGCAVISCAARAVFSTVDLSGGTTPDLMRMLEKNFGKNITTRSWNTFMKVAQQL
jgi:uncharacterized protein (DUF1697 family)